MDQQSEENKTFIYYLAKVILVITYPFTGLFSLIFTGVLLFFSKISVLIFKILQKFDRN